MKIRFKPVYLVILLAFLISSCARMCGQMAYRNHVDDAASTHVYASASPEKIWREAASLLSELGHDPDASTAPVDNTYLTPWKGEPGNRTRLSARISRSKAGAQLRIHRIEEYQETIYPPGYDPYAPDAPKLDPSKLRHETRTARNRDLPLEWEVLQRVEPDVATRIEGEALHKQEITAEVVGNGCQ